MESYKVIEEIKKSGGTHYTKVIPGIISEWGLVPGDKIKLTYEKYSNEWLDLCNSFALSGKSISLFCKDRAEALIGEIKFVNRNTIDFLSNEQVYIIPFSQIKEIQEIKSEDE